MKRKIPLLAAVFVFIILAFTNLPENIHSTQIKKTESPPTNLNSKVFPLYFYNDRDTSRFKRMIKQMVDSNNVLTKDSTNKLKIIFQFFFQKTGELTLDMYIGNKNHKKFYDSLDIKLIPITTCTNHRPNIDDSKETYLGDQEISNQADVFDSLKILANVSINKYFLFIPTFDKDKYGRRTILYILYIADSFTDPSICSLPVTDVPKFAKTGITTNPSPPRKGN